MSQPTLDQRLKARSKPVGREHIMYQKWRDLLFVHWEFDPEIIQRSLPEGLSVDLYNNKAYLGVVPFFMNNIRPRFCPAVPRVSNFLEMNLRTYVYDRHGRPGVWFYSLDANQWLAVRVARTFFNLPYYDATMQAHKESVIDYKVSRKGCLSDFDSHFRYTELEELALPEPESLDFFLIERYYLFARNRAGTIFSGKVYHTPYPLRNVVAEVLKEGAIALAGFKRPNCPPDHVVMSSGVDVNIFAIEKVDCQI
jgi:uncharacterized protein YqjF (DUF2071 family)